MISCDFCDSWYHYTCIGLPQDCKALEKVHYKCVGCAIREGLFANTHNPNYSPILANRTQALKELSQTSSEINPLRNFYMSKLNPENRPDWSPKLNIEDS